MRTYFFILVAVVLFNAPLCVAQSNLYLDKTGKIEFFVRSGSMLPGFRSLEIVPEGNTWKCYQTSLIKTDLDGTTNDSSKKFIGNVSFELLTDLLSIIYEPDTLINIDHFNINKIELNNYIDSLRLIGGKPTISGFLNKQIIDKALYDLYNPSFKIGEHRDSYHIRITTSNNTIINTYASGYGYPDYEPWTIGNKKIYNPNVYFIFETIDSGNKKYQLIAQNRVLQDIKKQISKEMLPN